MAIRRGFLVQDEKPYYKEERIEIKWLGTVPVKMKEHLRELHAKLSTLYPDKKILEISSYSSDPLGVSLSAFNLQFFHKDANKLLPVEAVYQASKVSTAGGPHLELLDATGKEAKNSTKKKSKDKLVCFELYGDKYPITPDTLFYDWLYINALLQPQNKQLVDELLKLDADIYTDVAFSINGIACQAKSVAIFMSLNKQGLLRQKTASLEEFRTIY